MTPTFAMTSLTRGLLLGGWIAVASMPVAAQLPVPQMAGDWTGSGEIVVNWTKQRELAVQLTIADDGSVQGRIGDARLRDGRLSPNRGWLGRALNVKTDFIITGRLEGCLIAAEGVCRDSVNIPLDWSEGRFAGAVHSSGAKVGGKERMIFTARIKLVPVRS